jgi:hypothetical protein
VADIERLAIGEFDGPAALVALAVAVRLVDDVLDIILELLAVDVLVDVLELVTVDVEDPELDADLDLVGVRVSVVEEVVVRLVLIVRVDVPEELTLNELREDTDALEVPLDDRVAAPERLDVPVALEVLEPAGLRLELELAELDLESVAERDADAVVVADFEFVDVVVPVFELVTVRLLVVLAVPERLVVLVRVELEVLVPDLDEVDVLELLAEPVAVALARALGVAMAVGRLVSVARAERVAVRVVVAVEVGRAPAAMTCRGA